LQKVTSRTIQCNLLITEVLVKLRLLAVTFLGAALLGTLAVPAGAASKLTPYAQMQTVLKDANAESAVRVTTTAKMSGMRIVQVTNAGRIAGRQTITLTDSGKSDTLNVEYVAGALFLKGDATILTTYLALSQANANELAGQWFGVPKSSGYYTEIAQGLTISTGFAEVTMTASVASGPATSIAGVKVDALKGKTVKSAIDPSLTETLYYSTATRPLPVEVTQSVQGSLGTLLFSHWNEKVVVVAPKITLHLN
jgi:hypothetical protein